MKLKEKLKNWLFADEIKRIQILETCYKDQIDWCKERADESYRTSERARLSYQRSEKEVEECRKLITQLVDIGVDVGFHTEEHSWAVICIAGHPEYVKFLPLTHRDRITIESIDEEVYTYKDELYKRLKTIFPNLHQLKIKRIAEDIMKNESNNPSILHDKGGKRVIVESWNNEFNSHNM